MKRMHVHVGVKNLDESVRFYNALFGAEPAKLKPDYAKWMLEDPHLNFAISTRSGKTGLDHMGLQVDDAGELNALRDQMSAANISTHSDGETTCCYAKSENPGWRTRTALPGKPITRWRTRRFTPALMRSRKRLAAPLQPRKASAVRRSQNWPLPPLAARCRHDRYDLPHPACGTSRNVLALIRNSGEEPQIIEYLKTPPSRAELASLIGRMGIPVRDALRRKGTPFDELGLDNPALTDNDLLDAMMAHPILINRPIVVTPRAVKLCRPSETVLDILPNPQRGAFSKEDGGAVVDAGGNRVASPAP